MIGRAGVLDDQIGEGVGFTLPNGNIIVEIEQALAESSAVT